jgi:predicted ATP-binding protein involved in virulence
MRIKQVYIKGLFGIFNHVIPLIKTEDKITIVYGLNGIGKTIMLKMIHGIFNSKYTVFEKIPFLSFAVYFEDNSSLEIAKKTEGENKTITLKLDSEDIHIPLERLIKRNRKSLLEKYMTEGRSGNFSIKIESDSSMLKRYFESFENIEFASDIDRIKSDRKNETKLQKAIDKFYKICDETNVHMVESQRLFDPAIFKSSSISDSDDDLEYIKPTVSKYSEQLSQFIEANLAEYGTVSQSLDRTFPSRVLEQKSSKVTGEELSSKLDELEKTRSRLMRVGLLTEDRKSEDRLPNIEIENAVARNILSVYVEDTKKKLDVFTELANKLELLRRIINSKFAYSRKEINFSKDQGFVFNILYESPFSQNIISAKDLSSGEQHELVLLYELLFNVKPNSLVLIDEPEISLHVGWQTQFLKDLQDIAKLANIDILMATHSPDIIQDRWDLTVELKGTAEVR